MNDTKYIYIVSEKSDEKIIKEKKKEKRVVVKEKSWKFTKNDLEFENQIHILQEKSTKLIQQIKNKISSYKSQDMEKNIFDSEKFVDISGVFQKLLDSHLHCFYCKNPILLIYEFVREPKQWTLERINNQYGHNTDNIEIACLSCNIRRRTMHYERYIQTKEIQNIVKLL
jgi:hypothetical protein